MPQFWVLELNKITIKYKAVLNFSSIVINKIRKCKRSFRSRIPRYRNYNRDSRSYYCCNTNNKDKYFAITKLIDISIKWVRLQIHSLFLKILLINSSLLFLNNLMWLIKEQKKFAIVIVNFILIYRKWKIKPIKLGLTLFIQSVPRQTRKKDDL